MTAGAKAHARWRRMIAREKCLVCGHYHGGQGNCITAHAFVASDDCPTCKANPRKGVLA